MRIPWLFRLRSILSLILMGFILVVIPLVAALGIMAFYVDRLAEQSRVAVVQAVEAIQGGRLLVSQITSMERHVRQHLVLDSPELLESYRETHDALQRTLERLFVLDLEAEQRDTLTRLSEAEAGLYQILSTLYAGAQAEGEQPALMENIDLEREVEKFVQVQERAREFLSQSSDWVDREVAGLEALAERATLMLGWLIVALIPTVVLLTGGFAALITRPLRHMAQAIHQLGNEDFATPVVVRGPRDLEELGERLDWLRGRLAELEEQKARFLRHMSHELKTPLTDLREGVELLSDQIVGPLNADQQEVVAILRENSLRLQRLIEDLLNFNQALSRNLELHKEPVDLAELVREVVEVQRLAWKARHLHIVEKLKRVRLMADREKLATVVDNLLSNAIKFSPPEGEIRLGLKAVDGVARLEVRDSGPGFHPKDRGRIFEAFYQGRTVAEGHVKGSGLGLAIAREYAAIHGGTLEIVADDAPGGCVRLSLPIKK